jgi:glycine oxidase
LTQTATCDVLVIGGGIVGAACAWRLAQHNHRVILCDAGKLGGEASWAGAGMLVPGSEFDEPGEELALGEESLALYAPFLEELRQATGVAIDFSLTGTLEIAADATDLERLTVRAARQRAFGVPSTVVDPADLPGRFSGFSRPLHGAIFYPQEGQVDPRTVIDALRVALPQSGAEVREHAAIRSLQLGTHAAVAHTASGDTIEAGRVLLAAGAWATAIDGLPAALPRAYPVKGHLIGYPLAAGSLPHVMRFHETYLVQRTGGYTIAGTSVEHVGFDRTVRPEEVASIARRAHDLAGGLIPTTPRDAWVGFRPAAESPLPLIGRHQDTPLWLAYGHFRNGILWAPLTAERIAAAMA